MTVQQFPRSLVSSPTVTATRFGLLVATALPPRDHPIASFDPGRYHATVPSWTNPDTSRADADSVVVPPAVVAVVVTIPADPDINALGLGWSGERRSRQHCYGCRRVNGYFSQPVLGNSVIESTIDRQK